MMTISEVCFLNSVGDFNFKIKSCKNVVECKQRPQTGSHLIVLVSACTCL